MLFVISIRIDLESGREAVFADELFVRRDLPRIERQRSVRVRGRLRQSQRRLRRQLLPQSTHCELPQATHDQLLEDEEQEGNRRRSLRL